MLLTSSGKPGGTASTSFSCNVEGEHVSYDLKLVSVSLTSRVVAWACNQSGWDLTMRP